jgi:hypothetical protein
VNILALIAVSVLNYGTNLDQFYKFAPGTSWTFDRVQNGTKSKVVLEVIRRSDGQVFLSSKKYKPGEKKPSITKSMVWYVEQGYWQWDLIKDGQRIEQLRALKRGAKKGDTWESPLGNRTLSFTVTHKGVTTVSVPAGTYKNAVHINFHLTVVHQTFQMDLYFVPGIGMVKMVEQRKDLKSTMRLAKRGKVSR